ncbi:MAG: energy transducer TonB, partial [Prevotella sp.]
SFVLDKKGQVRNVSVIGMLSPVLDREAVRVIKLMPNWVPGEINGVPVNTQMIIPVTFFSR